MLQNALCHGDDGNGFGGESRRHPLAHRIDQPDPARIGEIGLVDDRLADFPPAQEVIAKDPGQQSAGTVGGQQAAIGGLDHEIGAA